MNKKTEYYVKRVKLLTKERSKLKKEREKIENGLRKESKDGSCSRGSVGMDIAVNNDRNRRISAIDESLNKINIELFVIEYAALICATKLSPSAKRNGFVTNEGYAYYKLDEMVEKYGEEKIDRYLNSSHWGETISPLGLHGDVMYRNILDARDKMTAKEANKISRR